jgi:hypothetical protein
MNYLSRLAQLTGIGPSQERIPGFGQREHFYASDISREDVVLIDSPGAGLNKPLVREVPEKSLNHSSSHSGNIAPVNDEPAPFTPEKETVNPVISDPNDNNNISDISENYHIEQELPLRGPEDSVIQQNRKKIERRDRPATEQQHINSGQEEVGLSGGGVQEEFKVIIAPSPKTMAQRPEDLEGGDNQEEVSPQRIISAVRQKTSAEINPTLIEVRKWIAQGVDKEAIAEFPVKRPETEYSERGTLRRQDQRQLPKMPFPQEITMQPETEVLNDYHLSIGSINMIVEAPDRESRTSQVRQAPKEPQPVHKDYGSRLSRHYIRIR